VFTERLRRLGYGWLLLQGLLAAVAPKKSIALNVRLWGSPFENADELEPEDWYVRSMRAAGVGMVAAGGVGLLLDDRANDGDGGDDGGDGVEPIDVDTDAT